MAKINRDLVFLWSLWWELCFAAVDSIEVDVSMEKETSERDFHHSFFSGGDFNLVEIHLCWAWA